MSLAETIGEAFEAISGAIPEVAETVAYSGNRRENGALRLISLPVKAIVTEGGGDLVADAAAPSRPQSWTLRVLESDWIEATPPQAGDKVRFPRRTGSGVFRVKNVETHDNFGYMTITVESGDDGRW